MIIRINMTFCAKPRQVAKSPHSKATTCCCQRNRLNNVAAYDFIDYIHAQHDATKNCVTSVEVRLRRMCYEPLRAARVFARKRHAYRCPVIEQLIDLTANLMSGSAIAVAARVAILNHKVRHYAVNSDVAVIISLS